MWYEIKLVTWNTNKASYQREVLVRTREKLPNYPSFRERNVARILWQEWSKNSNALRTRLRVPVPFVRSSCYNTYWHANLIIHRFDYPKSSESHHQHSYDRSYPIVKSSDIWSRHLRSHFSAYGLNISREWRDKSRGQQETPNTNVHLELHCHVLHLVIGIEIIYHTEAESFGLS